MTKAVKNIKPSWGMVLSDNGVTVTVTCRWYKGQISLDPEDLDLEKQASSSPEFQKLFSLGRKLVIPKEIFDKFHRIETRARAKLDKYSFDTPFGSFVPYTAMPIFEPEVTEVENEYWEAVADVKKNYFKYRTQTINDYTALAKKIFTNGNARLNTARLLRVVRNAMPSQKELSGYYEFDWTPYHIQTPSELVADQKKAEVLAEGKAVKHRVNQKLAAKYEKKSAAAIESFIGSAVKQMRGVVNELVGAALKSIDKNDGVLVPRLSTTLKAMTEQFKIMNCFGDGEIEEKLGKLKTYLSETDGDGAKRTPQVKEMLKELRANLKERISEENLFIRSTRKGVEL